VTIPFRSYILCLTILIGFLSSCNKDQQSIQWYYWKQDFNLNEAQEGLIDTLGTQKIYVKYFDVDYKDGETKPLALIQINTTPQRREVVPCIYITNRTFDDAKRAATKKFDAEVLANKIFKLIEEIGDKNRVNPYQEVQFDCDWSSSTKVNYFAFLDAFKEYCEKLY